MPTSAEQQIVLLDTSAAVALSLADHEHHAVTTSSLRGMRLGLAGHAAFETFSILTRLPGPNRRPPAVIANLLRNNFPETTFLSTKTTQAVYSGLIGGELSGGAIYDALVGAVAVRVRVTVGLQRCRVLLLVLHVESLTLPVRQALERQRE